MLCASMPWKSRRAGERAASLTKQLLAFSRQQVLTPAVLNINTLASDMQKMLLRLLSETLKFRWSWIPRLAA